MTPATRNHRLQRLWAATLSASLAASLAACGADVPVAGRVGAGLDGVAATPGSVAATPGTATIPVSVTTPAGAASLAAGGQSGVIVAGVTTAPGATIASCTVGLHCAP
jgi:hypothetical protein